MPLFYFKCSECQKPRTVICSVKKVDDKRTCDSCEGELVRTPVGPGTSCVETLDNGLMAKKIERLSNAEEIYRERSEKDSRDKGFKKNEDDPKDII